MNNDQNKTISEDAVITLETLALELLSKKQLRIKPSTYNKYNNLLLNHILPEFGTLGVSDYSIDRFESGLKAIAYS